MRNWLIGFTIFLLLAAAGLMKIEFSASPTSTPAAVNNPLFQSLDPTHLKDLLPKHRFTLVNMWASWCGPCKAEFPELMELKKRHAGQGLDVVFMSVDRPADRGDASAFLMEQKIDFL